MFLSREIDIKLCQIYTKTFICKILYNICIIKQIIFNKHATNLKTTIYRRNLRTSGLLRLLFEFNNFSFLKDIIDNIIYTSGSWGRELQPMAVQYYCHLSSSVSRDHYTVLPLEGVLVTWYGRISYILYMLWYNFDTILMSISPDKNIR